MLNYNKVILCGVVCNTPTLRHNGNGTSVTNFTLKTIERWKDRRTGDLKKYSKYHKIVVWGKNAEHTVKFVKKNVIVLVEGCLNYHKYPKMGEQKNIAEIKASNVEYRGVLKSKTTNYHEGVKDDKQQTDSPVDNVNRKEEINIHEPNN